jgi:single-strand DNA-binding protein
LPPSSVADGIRASRSLRSLTLAPRARFRSAASRRVGLCQPSDPHKEEPKTSAQALAVNAVALVGNLTADPVLKQLDDDRRVCNLRVAVNDQRGQPPMFIDVATLGAQADACARYLTKGRAIAVTGRLVYREWDDNGTRRSRHHIVGRVQFGGKPEEAAAQPEDANEEVAKFLTATGAGGQNTAGATRSSTRPAFRPPAQQRPRHDHGRCRTSPSASIPSNPLDR